MTGSRNLVNELADANKGRWDMVEVLLGFRHGDIELLWPRALDEARRLVAQQERAA